MGKAEEEEARKRAQEEKARREAREQREREASKRAEEVMYLCFHSSPQKLLFVSPPYMVGLFCNGCDFFLTSGKTGTLTERARRAGGL